MAAKSNIGLFFERFLSFNQDRYADDPKFGPMFADLEESEVVVSEITPTNGGAQRTAKVVSLSRNFSGEGQTWTPGLAATDLNLYILESQNPLESFEELAKQTVNGIYAYLGEDDDILVGVVANFDVAEEGEAAAVEAVLRAGLVYDLPEDSITVDNAANTITIDSDTYGGVLAYAIGTEPVRIIPATDYGVLAGEEPVQG